MGIRRGRRGRDWGEGIRNLGFRRGGCVTCHAQPRRWSEWTRRGTFLGHVTNFAARVANFKLMLRSLLSPFDFLVTFIIRITPNISSNIKNYKSYFNFLQ
jgi:hypothetical protein